MEHIQIINKNNILYFRWQDIIQRVQCALKVCDYSAHEISIMGGAINDLESNEILLTEAGLYRTLYSSPDNATFAYHMYTKINAYRISQDALQSAPRNVTINNKITASVVYAGAEPRVGKLGGSALDKLFKR